MTLDERTVSVLDRWFREGRYPNWSTALHPAFEGLAERKKRSRLAREFARLDRAGEQRMAEEGLGDESWPAF